MQSGFCLPHKRMGFANARVSQRIQVEYGTLSCQSFINVELTPNLLSEPLISSKAVNFLYGMTDPCHTFVEQTSAS